MPSWCQMVKPTERGRGGLVRLVRLYKRKHEEARVLLREREKELARVRRTIGVTRPEPVPPSQPAGVPEPEQPASASQAPSRLSVAEQDAINWGLTGPPWWADHEALDARREARRVANCPGRIRTFNLQVANRSPCRGSTWTPFSFSYTRLPLRYQLRSSSAGDVKGGRSWRP
jgi:hypothetical protein